MIRMRFWSPFRSIQTKIAFAYAFLILVTVFVMSVTSFLLSRDAVQDNVRIYTTELVDQVNRNIEAYVNGMLYMSDLVAENRTVREYLSASSFESLEQEKTYKMNVADFLESMLVSRNDIASVSIMAESGQLVTAPKYLEPNPHADIRTMDWYRKAKEAGGRNVISPSHVQPVFRDRYPWVVTLSRSIHSDDGREIGVFWADLNFSVMNDMLQNINLGRRGYLFIVDQEGKIVYHPQQQLIYSGLKSERIEEVLRIQKGTFVSDEGSDSRMYTVQDSGFGWKIVGVSYVNEMVGNQTEVGLSFAILGLICIGIAILIAVFLSRRVSKPIKQLQKYMKEVEKGNFDIQVPVPKSIEVGLLARAFNMMVGKIKELMAQVVSDQEQKRKSEINALQAQIHPHFLYNTLDSIIWMAESNKPKEVVLMTSALAKLLRSSIGRGEELVSIRTEIEHIDSYLKIQQMRYRNKLDYRIEIAERVQEYPIIKVVLQPIVENAIYHGIKKKRGPGRIDIVSKETDTDILLIVRDNGIGMDEATVGGLLQPLSGERGGRGVGVRNVHERLRLYFGEPYGLSFESEPGEGTAVTIRLPKNRPFGRENRDAS